MCPTIYVHFRGATSNKTLSRAFVFIGFVVCSEQARILSIRKNCYYFDQNYGKKTFSCLLLCYRFMTNGNFPFIIIMRYNFGQNGQIFLLWSEPTVAAIIETKRTHVYIIIMMGLESGARNPSVYQERQLTVIIIIMVRQIVYLRWVSLPLIFQQRQMTNVRS